MTSLSTWIHVERRGSRSASLLTSGLVAGLVVACTGAPPEAEHENAAALGSVPRKTISAAPQHLCVITDGGGAKCFGENTWGERGNGARGLPDDNDQVDDSEYAPDGFQWPATPVVGLSDVREISAGGDRTCAVVAAGNVACWGSGYWGTTLQPSQTWAPAYSPVVLPGLTEATSVSVNIWHACAIAAGQVRCWGRNDFGQLGDGTRLPAEPSGALNWVSTPSVVSGISGVVSVSVGWYHACAVLDTGDVKCWGAERQSPERYDLNPVTFDGAHGAVAVSAGARHTCALMPDGAVKCWPTNQAWVDAGYYPSMEPTEIPELRGAHAISSGVDRTCAVFDGGVVKCWGLFPFFSPDPEHLTMKVETVPNLSGATDVTCSMEAAEEYCCAQQDHGGPTCWGHVFPLEISCALETPSHMKCVERPVTLQTIDVTTLPDGHL